MTNEPSPRPWRLEDSGTIRDANGCVVVSALNPCGHKTRRLIVDAVNERDRLRDLVKRYGVTYSVTSTGSSGAILRLWEMLSRCCCYVCHNRNCREPRNRKLRNCKHDCELFTRTPYCQRKKAEGGDHA